MSTETRREIYHTPIETVAVEKPRSTRIHIVYGMGGGESQANSQMSRATKYISQFNEPEVIYIFNGRRWCLEVDSGSQTRGGGPYEFSDCVRTNLEDTYGIDSPACRPHWTLDEYTSLPHVECDYFIQLENVWYENPTILNGTNLKVNKKYVVFQRLPDFECSNFHILS
jgi:hypothetical protein